MYQNEYRLVQKGYRYIAGCDEVGRGPLAGPVVACSVILDPAHPIEGLNDSKKLSESKREFLYKEIHEHALDIQVTYIYEDEIDRINIYQASKKAMIESIRKHPYKVDYVLSDAMPLPELGIPFEAIIKGDTKSATIAAASIIAKVERDHFMVQMNSVYPGYHFDKHKGYPTKAHLAALREFGPCPIHRKTYQPVKDVLQVQLSLGIEEG